jgi:D-beta-D-heptose 7-phosphate kinase/D-beta-D-heptose 1-phosphate adenosyltransferase
MVEGMADRRVVVVGDLMLDHFIWGDVERISPEAPVPVVRVRRESFHPGGCGNVAANLRSLGARPVVVAPIGADRSAGLLRKVMVDLGIDAGSLTEIPGRTTTKKTRIVAHHQQVVRFDREDETALPGGADALRDAALAALEEADALIISDYDKGAITPELLEALLPAARERGIPSAVDPKPTNFPHYRSATLITPNQKEAAQGAGFPIRTDEDLLRAGKKIREMLGADGILVTQGEAGMCLFEEGDRVTRIPATAREVFDVTGAGDTVVATCALALAARGSYEEAAVLGNLAAGDVVGEVGTAAIEVDRLKRAIHEKFGRARQTRILPKDAEGC